MLTCTLLFDARDSHRLLEAHVDRMGLPSAAELAELRPARCSAGSLKRLPRSLRHRIFGACARGAHAKSVPELLRCPNRSRAPLGKDEHAAACAVCESCIEWAPSARPPAQQLVGLVADAVRSIAKVPASEPVWVHEAWRRCKRDAKRSSPMSPSSPSSPSSVRAAYSPAKRVVVARPCTPRSTSHPDSPIKFSPVSALTPSFENEPMTRGRSLLLLASELASSDDEALIGTPDSAEAALRKLPETVTVEHSQKGLEAAEDASRPRDDSESSNDRAERSFGSTPVKLDVDLKREIYDLYYAEKSPRSNRSDITDITDSAVTVPMLNPEDAFPAVAQQSECVATLHFPEVAAGTAHPYC